MWNNGIATMLTDAGVMPISRTASSNSAPRLSLLSITPFGSPVVPEV